MSTFLVKHKKTDRFVTVYGTTHTRGMVVFLVWYQTLKKFMWVNAEEFERLEGDKDTDYVED